MRTYGWLALLVLALLGVRAASMAVVSQPGYTDAYYYATVASRLAHGDGLTADFVWNFLEAPRFAELPVPSHRFWMPLASVVQAGGIALLGGPLGDFRSAQLAIVAVAALIPVVAHVAARSLGATPLAALMAGALAGLGGALAPGWVSLDSFPIAAVLGTLFFLALGPAARGSLPAGLVAGSLVGLLHLARAEGALFGLALVWLAGRPRSRRAGMAGAAVALAVGLGWLARNALLGLPEDLLARATLLVSYEGFFALRPPTLAAFLGSPAEVVAAKAAALATNALTAAITVLLVPLVPMAVAVRRRWDRPEVRAFVWLALAVYLVQSVAFTLHSVRGSFFHSVAALFPFALALAAAGADDLFAAPADRLPASAPLPARAEARMPRAVAVALVAGFGVVSVFTLGQWDVDFNTPYRERLAALPLLPSGPLVVTDAAAWRWISGRRAVLAPADGPQAALCAAEVYLAEAFVLEPSHFSAYDEMYSSRRSDLFTWRAEHGGIRIYTARPDQRCIIAGVFLAGAPPDRSATAR